VDATLADLVTLIAGFVMTTSYKLFAGVDAEPCKGGILPIMPSPRWGAGADAAAPLFDPQHTDNMRWVRGFMGLAQFSGLVTAAWADCAPAFSMPGGTTAGLVVPFLNIVLGNMPDLVNNPDVLGREWTPGSITSFVASCVLAAANSFTLIWYLLTDDKDRPDRTGAFKNLGVVSPLPGVPMVPSVGPIAVSLVTGAKFAGAILGSDLPNPYVGSQLLLGVLPGILQFTRFGLIRDEPVSQGVAASVAALDLMCTGSAGLMATCAGFMPNLKVESPTAMVPVTVFVSVSKTDTVPSDPFAT
jgi:hypothetical protein